MLQFCTKRSQIPYYIRPIDTNVYSLEEINYFLYNHMNMVYREFFCGELFDYIEKELEQAKLAEKLRQMDEQDASIQDFIMCVLKESYFYSPNDLGAVSNLVLNINNMTRAERMFMEGASMMQKKQYESALKIYFDILNNREGMSEAFYAKTAFSIGIIYARLFKAANANSFFTYAYELFPDPTYAKACVYMSIVNNDEEELLRCIIRYKVSDEALAAIHKKVDTMRIEIMRGKEMKDLTETLQRGEPIENIVANWKNEYYTMQS
ncbi:MAG: hypothetical protein ACOX75_01280 [Lachnospiraceae bacterium]|jgi:tetratricopeptide (TPR) repeat protein